MTQRGEDYAIEAVARPSLSSELVERMREMILEGELEAGKKVPERRLTELFGVSRTPLREAIKILAHEGYVALVPNRGAVVAEDDEAEIDELFPILAALEGLAGELAALRADEAMIGEITERTDALRRSFESRDRLVYFETNQAIHDGLLEASGNRSLIRQHGLIARRIFRARYQANLSEIRWREAIEEHEAMSAALKRRDPEGLGRTMRAHLMNKLRSIREGREAKRKGSEARTAASAGEFA
ncbi:GntR family transcriptional regulator [Fulvimarina endophytica]|uniref:GntR family transcriptional regulator n=1 Tax=Fulvimarina endophytica TaxID=2293836 RepID=A0A371WZF1_9HYPH|nr:GntR family transcriptional regulator [Fulvimarina endophytica]RFC62306.1 GntR family transcriptional regulator [Fulvimarina endophytica]